MMSKNNVHLFFNTSLTGYVQYGWSLEFSFLLKVPVFTS